MGIYLLTVCGVEQTMKLEKILEAGLGVYLILPSIEDVATGGATLVPSAALGALLIADAFGVKL